MELSTHAHNVLAHPLFQIRKWQGRLDLINNVSNKYGLNFVLALISGRGGADWSIKFGIRYFINYSRFDSAKCDTKQKNSVTQHDLC